MCITVICERDVNVQHRAKGLSTGIAAPRRGFEIWNEDLHHSEFTKKLNLEDYFLPKVRYRVYLLAFYNCSNWYLSHNSTFDHYFLTLVHNVVILKFPTTSWQSFTDKLQAHTSCQTCYEPLKSDINCHRTLNNAHLPETFFVQTNSQLSFWQHCLCW